MLDGKYTAGDEILHGRRKWSTDEAVHPPKTLLLTIRRTAPDRLDIGARLLLPDDVGPLGWRGEHHIDPAALEREITALAAARRQAMAGAGPERLESAGQLLFDLLLPEPVKQAVRRLDGHGLMVEQAGLDGLPWALLDDGRGPLGVRLALGEAGIGDPWTGAEALGDARILVLADPAADLPAARAEGEALAAIFAEAPHAPAFDLRLGRTGRAEVLRGLRRYGVVHLAGHVDPPGEGPAGWRLADGLLTAADLELLRGGVMPRLVFANACRSTRLAPALLDVGVRHVIATDVDLPDLAGADFAAAFYRASTRGAPVGEALRRARAEAVERGDRTWLAYRLFGDPRTRHGRSAEVSPPAELRRAVVLAVRHDPRGELEARVEATRARQRRFAEVVGAAGGRTLPATGALDRAVFGVPARREDDARRAARAALLLLTELPDAVAALDGGRLAVSGRSMLGAPLDRAERTVWSADAGVWIAPAVARTLRGARIEGGRLLALAHPPAPVGPFIGRRAELDRIEALVPGEALTIVGPAGIGKSRLLDAARRRLQLRAVVQAPADAEGPYGGLAPLVRRLCGLDESADRPTTEAAIGAALAGEADDFTPIDRLLATDPRDHGETLLAMLGFGERAADGETDARVAAALRALIEAAGAAVILEDAWRSPAAGVIEALVADPPAGALLLVTTRPAFVEGRPGWFRSSRHHRLDLGPLPDRAARALACALRPDAEGEAIDALSARAEGNPLFVHELARIVDHPDDGLPDTIEAVMQARLDRLDAEERQVLRAAAVLGRVFWREGVERLLGRAELQPTLDRLAAARFIVPEAESALPGQTAWRFAHGLLHAVVERSLPRHARAALHGRAALWLADEIGGDAAPRRARIAAHRAASGDSARARIDWLAAADHAETSLATDAARRALRAALALFGDDDPAEQAALEARLGDLDRVAGDLDAAARRFEAALSLTVAPGARALYRSRASAVALARGRTAEARALGDGALADLARAAAVEPDQRAEIVHQVAWLDYHAGALDRAEERLNRLVEALPRSARRARGLAWHLLGTIAQQRGRAEQAGAWLRRALALLGPHDPQRARVVHGLALVAVQRGDYDAAARHYAEGIRLRARRGDLAGLAKTYSNLGTLHGERGGPGDYARAARYLQEAIRIRARIGHAALAISRANLGDLYLRQGRIADARAELEQATVADPPSWARSELWRMTADLRLRQGDLEAAAEGVEQALQAARALADRVREAAALDLAATIATARGRADEARAALEAALVIQREREALGPIAEAASRLAAHIAASDPARAAELRDEAGTLRAMLTD